MPRLPRVYIENILYYVAARGGHNQTVFVDETDYKEYISLIDKYKEQYGFKLYAYALLPTHLHMLIEVRNNIGISNIMHDINSLYTKLHNSRYNKKGHLFEARFHSVFAEKETFLLPLMRHIHLNPIRMGLTNSSDQYLYSSYSQFIDPNKRMEPNLTGEIEEVFEKLGGREEAFMRYVVEALDQKKTREFEKRIHKKRILGSKEFSKNIKKIIEDEKQKQKRQRLFARRLRLIIVAAASAVALFTTFTVDYFYRQRKSIETEYEKTLTRYEATLNMLRRERDNALKAREDIAGYQWKIEIVEKTLENLKQERKKALKTERQIEGYRWRIRLSQTRGPKGSYPAYDMIAIFDKHISSTNLNKEGFSRSRYSRREISGGVVIWETIQSNGKGDKASWRGEWNGRVMKGVLRRSMSDGKVIDFSFESTGDRIKM